MSPVNKNGGSKQPQESISAEVEPSFAVSCWWRLEMEEQGEEGTRGSGVLVPFGSSKRRLDQGSWELMETVTWDAELFIHSPRYADWFWAIGHPSRGYKSAS